MLTYTITKKDASLSGEITFAPTKSISSRNLVIQAIKNSKFDIKSVSEKDAEKVIDKSIRKGKVALDTGNPEKAIRFLGAFLAYFGGEWIITGSREMKKRPVADVIDFLNKNGHNIKYLEREGFPPLKIIGKGLGGPILRVDASICSQFISTSLLISQTLSHDEVIDLKDWIVESPYISQTIRLLNYLGVNSGWNKQEMLVEYDLHDGAEMAVEGDWLAASYWYQIAALSNNAEIKINGLNFESVQGDAIVKEIFEPIGVKSIPIDNGVLIKSTKRKIKSFQYDFTNSPDLIPLLVVTCVGLGIPFRFQGVESLRLKDVDRVMVLQSQMLKLGAKLKVEKRGELETIVFDGETEFEEESTIELNSFSDHRMLMSLAPLSALGLKVIIDDPRAVSRSYSGYWNDFRKVGFNVE